MIVGFLFPWWGGLILEVGRRWRGGFFWAVFDVGGRFLPSFRGCGPLLAHFAVQEREAAEVIQ